MYDFTRYLSKERLIGYQQGTAYQQVCVVSLLIILHIKMLVITTDTVLFATLFKKKNKAHFTEQEECHIEILSLGGVFNFSLLNVLNHHREQKEVWLQPRYKLIEWFQIEEDCIEILYVRQAGM